MNKKYFLIPILLIIGFIAIYFFTNKPIIKNYPPKNQTIIAFGDSLIRGTGSTLGNDFISLLSKKLNKNIINEGIPGETTSDALNRVDEIINKDPGTVILLFGGNDFLRNRPQTETFSNLRLLIKKLQDNGSMVILLGIRGGLLVDKFSSDFEKLADETGVIFIPNVLDGLIGKPKYMSSDNIHPNNEGYAKIADKVYKVIKNYLK